VAETVHEEMLHRAAALLDGAELTDPVVRWLEDYRLYVAEGAAGEGLEYVWLPEDDERWVVLEQPSTIYVCRGQHLCPNPPVLRLNRASRSRTDTLRPRWWYYCEAHAFGRRIRDGKLEVRKLVKKGSVA